MHAFLEIAHTGLVAILLHPMRSLAILGSLVVVLLPYLVGLGVSQGIQAEAEASIRFGADLYVTGSRFGRDAPVPLAVVEQVRGIDGVTEVTPRIVGAIVLGKAQENAVLVGLPRERFPPAITCVEGRLPGPGNRNELVVGTELARRLRLEVGSLIPPFYRSDRGERVSEVVGLFKSDVPLWQANLILTSFETASAIFNQHELATDLLVDCRPGYSESVRGRIVQTVSFGQGAGIRPRITAREDLQVLLPSGLLHREGIFNLFFVLAFAVAILVVLVTSGFGLSERRREIGILKATGWQTDEILLRSSVESLTLSVIAASLSILLAYVWLRFFNGFGIAGVFLAGATAAPSFTVPFRLGPVPALLALAIAFVVLAIGTLYPTWRAATVAPREAMR